MNERTAWRVEHHVGSAAAFHQRALPDPARRAVWWFDVDRPALVLGSAQADDVVDRAAASAAGVDVVRRRSGGGAVLLTPGDVTWVDVVIPSDDRLWDHDVGRAFHWLGEAWAAALAAVGISPVAVHRGALRRATLVEPRVLRRSRPRRGHGRRPQGRRPVPTTEPGGCPLPVRAAAPLGAPPAPRPAGAVGRRASHGGRRPGRHRRRDPPGPAPTSRRRSWPRCRSERRAVAGYRRFALMVHC